MNVVTGLVIYFIIWWLVLFMVLPWGNQPREAPEAGHVASAPAKPRIGLKFLIATGISALFFLIVWATIESGWIDFRTL